MRISRWLFSADCSIESLHITFEKEKLQVLSHDRNPKKARLVGGVKKWRGLIVRRMIQMETECTFEMLILILVNEIFFRRKQILHKNSTKKHYFGRLHLNYSHYEQRLNNIGI